jgi:glycosyltransferase involved in cell wall biosynthesis
MRGGERCLEVLCELFPEAPLFTLVDSSDSDPSHTVTPAIRHRAIKTSLLQHIPFRDAVYRKFLPIFHCAVRRFDLSPFDLIISVSHCVAKAVIRPPHALHVCYCLTPMRYIWDRYPDYLAGTGTVTRFGLAAFRRALQRRDQDTSNVDHFIALSSYVSAQITSYYGRRAAIVHPPVDVSRFTVSETVDDFYLVVSALVPYKRIDIAIEAARRLGRRLLVVGDGPEASRLRRLTLGTKAIQLLGWRDDATVANLLARCRAVIFTACEDFGIVPLEAAAAGRPTIAFGKGGVLDTMVDLAHSNGQTPTSVFFHGQTPEALMEGIHVFETTEEQFSPPALREHALKFDRPRFKELLSKTIQDLWLAHSSRL